MMKEDAKDLVDAVLKKAEVTVEVKGEEGSGLSLPTWGKDDPEFLKEFSSKNLAAMDRTFDLMSGKLAESAKALLEDRGPALHRMCILKGLEGLAKDISKELLPFANREFRDGETSCLPEGFSIRKASERKTWKYSASVEKLAAQLKKAQEADIKAHRAKDVTDHDPCKRQLFQISSSI